MNNRIGQTPRALAPQQPRTGTQRKTLAAVLGSAFAAAALFVSVPHDESGRKVEATVNPTTGQATVRHISGPQYLRAYLDIVQVPTICDGITRDVRMGQTATPQQCTELLERELVIHAEGVMRCTPTLAGRPYQQVAAVSLAYNVGVAGYCRSTVARRFNERRWREGCDALLMWNKAGGRVVRGLTLRRERERAICLRGV